MTTQSRQCVSCPLLCNRLTQPCGSQQYTSVTVSVGQEPRHLARCPASKSATEYQLWSLGGWTRTAASGSLTCLGAGLRLPRAVGREPRFLGGCWLEAPSVPCHAGLSMGSLTAWQLAAVRQARKATPGGVGFTVCVLVLSMVSAARTGGGAAPGPSARAGVPGPPPRGPPQQLLRAFLSGNVSTVEQLMFRNVCEGIF